jgi:hypothetical protein
VSGIDNSGWASIKELRGRIESLTGGTFTVNRSRAIAVFRTFVFSLCMFSASFSVAQDETPPNNNRFVLSLNDGLVQSFKSLGSLQSQVPADAQGKIAAVQLQFSGLVTDAAENVAADVTVEGNVCRIALNDELIERIRNRPARISVPSNSQFSRVLLTYPALQLSPPAAEGSASQNPAGFFQHVVSLTTGEKLTGQLDLGKELEFATRFGDVKIAVEQIAGIRMHVDAEDSAAIVLSNGDSISGIPGESSFELSTDWGRAVIDAVYVESIVFGETRQFRRSNEPGLGERWQLIGR